MKKCLPKTHHFSSGSRLLYFSGRIHQEEGKVSLASVALATYVAKQQAGYLLAGLNFQAAERLTAMTAEPIPFVKCFPASKTRYFAYFFTTFDALSHLLCVLLVDIISCN